MDGIWVGWGIEHLTCLKTEGQTVRMIIWCMAAMRSKPFILQEGPSQDGICCIAIHCQLTIWTWKSCFSLVIYLHVSSQISGLVGPKNALVARFFADQRKTEKLPLLWCVDIVQQLWVSTRKSVENRTFVAMIQGALGQRWSSVIPPQIPRRHKRDLVLCRGWGREGKQT